MENPMKDIRYIVYVMLENRSIDNLLGWLYDKVPSAPAYNGLKENAYYNLDSDVIKHYVTKGTNGYYNVPSLDPYEEYEHVNNQLFETGPKLPNNPAHNAPPTMGGFYKDYATWYDSAYQIMQTYTPEQLPVINGLAREFGVSDAYFSSLPTQTNCNRAFAATGNSLGLNSSGKLTGWVDNKFHDLTKLSVTFNQRTIWNVLYDHNHNTPDDWMIYYSKIWYQSNFCFTRDMFDQLHDKKYDHHFESIDTFYEKAKAGKLPRFSFLEPEWGLKKWHIGVNGDDYHPPCNLPPGEQFLNNIYEALTYDKTAWEQTLLIINFDEHGGTYDHVKPAWGAPVPWSNPDDGTPSPQVHTERHFGFDRYGVRVPLILVSPYVPKNTVFQSDEALPYDHCSVIASVLKHMQIDKSRWKLGTRVAKAPTFEKALSLPTARTDIPKFTPPTASEEEQNTDQPYNDLQYGIAHNMLRYHLEMIENQDALRISYNRHFGDHVQTRSQLARALHNTLNEAHGLPVLDD